MKKILVTGSEGFLGSNLISHLKYIEGVKLYFFNKKKNLNYLNKITKECDIIFHLAGENRSKDKKKFEINNQKLTSTLCSLLKQNKNKSPIIFSSSIKLTENSIYGRSKLLTEKILKNHSKSNKSFIKILRIPNVFGKWSKPNYNSFLATICHSIWRNKKINYIRLNDKIDLIYIDSLIKILSAFLKKKIKNNEVINIKPEKKILVSELYKKINSFYVDNQNGYLPNIKNRFDKNLHATFLSHVPKKKILTNKKKYIDKRGIFSEIFKSKTNGQFSIFSINPGKKRGGHFHHTKNEKFVLISGKSIFSTYDIKSKKKYKFYLKENTLNEIISVPGY